MSEEAYAVDRTAEIDKMHNAGGLDFYALTEHLEYMSYGEWRRMEDLTTFLQQGARVHFLHGFELAIAPGHANFLYLDPRVGEAVRVASLSPHHLDEVWPKLDAWIAPGSVLVVCHHQGHRQPDVTGTFAARYEPLMEIVQSRGKFGEWVETFLRAGCRVGFVGATDHAYAPPFPRALTGVWATDTSQEAVFDALWQRRTFATNGPQMRLFVTAAGVPMGGEGTVAGPPELRVDVAGTATVTIDTLHLGLCRFWCSTSILAPQRPYKRKSKVQSGLTWPLPRRRG